MSGSHGLRLSIAGAIVVAISMPALIFLPEALPAIAMMIGGIAVIGGFIWTLAAFYFPPSEEHHDPGP